MLSNERAGILEISGEAGEVGWAMGDVVEEEEVGSGECTIVEVRGSRVCRHCIGGEGQENDVEG